MASLASRLTQTLPARLPILALPRCANPACLRPPTLWQRWWARREGIACEKDWYCSPECFSGGLGPRVERLACGTGAVPTPRQRFPLGLLLLEQGVISQEQLHEALRRQRRAGAGRIGEWLVRGGAATESDIVGALSVQQNCPIFSNREPQSFPPAMQFPSPLIRRYEVVPVYFSAAANTLYLGFAACVNRALISAAGHILRCRIEPCIMTERIECLAAEAWNAAGRGETLCIERLQSAAEMTRSIAGYADQAKASSCLLARCQDYLWARLYGDIASLDLLFRVPSEGSESGPSLALHLV